MNLRSNSREEILYSLKERESLLRSKLDNLTLALGKSYLAAGRNAHYQDAKPVWDEIDKINVQLANLEVAKKVIEAL